jgi:hypothetical protein
VGDVLVQISYGGSASNRVRVAIGHMGGGPADDFGAVPTPPPSVQYLEAESGNVGSPMISASDPLASASQYVSSSTAGRGTVSLTFNAPVAGIYYVWGRVLAPNSGSDSFDVSMDGGTEDVYDAAENIWSTQWQWTQVNGRGALGVPLTLDPRTFTLLAGSHSIQFRVRDANSKLDRIFITNDVAAQPIDPSPTPTPTPTPTPSPSPTPTPPTGNNFYVSPTGAPTGNGSLANPWDLQTALDQPSGVTPGTTIYLRGGTYKGNFTSQLVGSQSSPITVRSYPGEWAQVDGYKLTTLSQGINSGDTLITLNDASGLSVGGKLELGLPNSNSIAGIEVALLTAKTGANTFRVVRGWDGTSAGSYSSGTSVISKADGIISV